MFSVLVTLVLVSLASLIRYCFNKYKNHVALDPNRFQSFTLIKKTQVSHDSFIFRFALQHEKCILGLPIGQHIVIRGMCDLGNGKKEMVQHSYTPITGNDEKGYVEFLIKVYFSNVNAKFPNGGRLSQYLHQLPIGKAVQMQGPKGFFEYLGCGRFKIALPGHKERFFTVDAFGMVGGGTGITPLLQIIRAIRNIPSDKTKVFLVYGSQTAQDILMRDELDALERESSGQVKVWYTIDRDAPLDWKYDTGYVTEEMFRKHLPIVNRLDDSSYSNNVGLQSVMALLCGPPPMIQFAIKPNLEKIGYTSETMFSF